MRSLRWDLIPVRLRNGILHAKISILQWSELIRLIIGSANLTEDGYRKNREVFGVLDYYKDSDSPLECLYATVDYLAELLNENHSPDLSSPAVERCLNFLKGIRHVNKKWGVVSQPKGKKNIHVYPVFTSRKRKPIFEQINEKWPDASPPSFAYVTTPFYDKTSENDVYVPSQKLWSVLKQRGGATVYYNVTAEDSDNQGSMVIHAPYKSLIKAQPENRTEVYSCFNLIDESQSDVESDEVFRPLHLKSIWLENNNWAQYIIGSSNFTSAGLGINKRYINYEANLCYTVSCNNKKGYNTLDKAYPSCTEIQNDTIKGGVYKPDNEDALDLNIVSLHDFFALAVYSRNKTGDEIITLYFNNEVNEADNWEI